MKIVAREIVDWEPLAVDLVLKRKSRARRALVGFVPRWLEQRRANRICDCTIKDGHVGVTVKAGRVGFACEWMCETCLEALGRALEEQFPEVDHIEIGYDDETSAVETKTSGQFISVPGKQVLLEDGSTVSVEAFEIAKSPVTVEQFEAFARAAGYETVAERQGYPRSYRDNELLLSKRNRGQYPAYVMAYADALAYCEWTGGRLPTEAEWVAAAILDERVIEDNDAYLRVCRQLMGRNDAIELGGNDWTSTLVKPDHVIVRGGPHLVRDRDWARFGRQGRLRHQLDLDLLYTFRVCKRR